jgi:hypothetical protein
MARDFLKREAIIEMTNLCMDYGASPKEAISSSEKFWNSKKKWLERVL